MSKRIPSKVQSSNPSSPSRFKKEIDQDSDSLADSIKEEEEDPKEENEDNTIIKLQ